MMGETVVLTPGLQCCLRCGRVLTDRALHDSMEESMLYAIRARHPEWAREKKAAGVAEGEEETGVECQPCLDEYRRLLGDRQTRAEKHSRAATETRPLWRPSSWINRMLSRTWSGGGGGGARA